MYDSVHLHCMYVRCAVPLNLKRAREDMTRKAAPTPSTFSHKVTRARLKFLAQSHKFRGTCTRPRLHYYHESVERG
jgi:hypothetical protein